MTTRLLLPNSSWPNLLNKLLDGRTAGVVSSSEDDLLFLEQSGLIGVDRSLSAAGLELCELLYVRNDKEAAARITHSAVISVPATQALLQAVAGLKDISVDQIRMALVFAGLSEMEVEACLTNFLTILNANSVITYNRKSRSVKLLVSPKRAAPPEHVYVDHQRPYTNDLRIREVLRECRGSIKWIDKYFQKEGFEWIWREATAENISRIEIVSTIDDSGLDPLAVADYRRLKKELGLKGISVDWKVLDRSDSYSFHDRWVIDDNGLCYNLPSINSIKSGQKSELHRSPNFVEVTAIYTEYFEKAKPV